MKSTSSIYEQGALIMKKYNIARVVLNIIVILLILAGLILSAVAFIEGESVLVWMIISAFVVVLLIVLKIASSIYFHKNKLRLFQEIQLAQQCNTIGVELATNFSVFNNHIDFLRVDDTINCSNSVVGGSKNNPIKYLIKYSEIEPSEEVLSSLDFCIDYLAKLEFVLNGVSELQSLIVSKVPFIFRVYVNEKIANIVCNFKKKGLGISHPEFVFSYVSPKGKSGNENVIVVSSDILKNVRAEISKKISKSGHSTTERNKMTADLRNYVKQRDNYTCQRCGNSVAKEPNLLLEVDHIKPISKGGKTEASNLQTLCWRCNRDKSDDL